MREPDVLLFHALPEENTEVDSPFDAAPAEADLDFHSTERWVARALDLEPPEPGKCDPYRPRTTGTIRPTSPWYTPEGIFNMLQHWWFDTPRVEKGMDIIVLVVSEAALVPALNALALRSLGWTNRFVNLGGRRLLYDRPGFYWRLYADGGRGGKFFMVEGNEWVQLTVKTVADELERAGYQGGRIRAYMCNSGSLAWGRNPPMQQLANELHSRGYHRVFLEGYTKRISRFDLKPEPGGQWLSFRPLR